MRPLSIYLHIPYCQAKCPYCDFNSYAAAVWPEAAYVAALRAELDSYAAHEAFRGATVETIFFGGGTPSLFAPASIGSVLDHVGRLWSVADDVESTLEANPGTVTASNLAGFRSAGINRISFGVQSFHAHHLARLGRIHSADEARSAVHLARAAGFDNLNIDLIYALPEQTVEEWEHDLAAAVSLSTEHVSAYNLTYEEGTAFHSWRAQGKLRQLAEEVEVGMFHLTQERLGHAGLGQYEISNYARPGRECRHNLTYWQGRAYIGAGAGAHGFTGAADSGQYGMRWGNEKNPGRYMAMVSERGHARATEEPLDREQACGEFVFLALRCRRGVSDTAFERRFGRQLAEAFPHVADLQSQDLLTHGDGHWALTARGLLLADSVFATFL